MVMPLEVGSVVEVRGTRVKIEVYKEMNHSSLIYQGEIINNISVNSFVIIKNGFLDLVGKIDAEYLEDLLNPKKSQERDDRYNKGTISKILEVQVLGYFDKRKFNNGVKFSPMIGNLVYIPKKQEILSIYSGSRENNIENNDSTFSIGRSMYEDISVDFSINSFFASHIGIIGNTGSGKSNTLAKVYYELFRNVEPASIKSTSSFHLIDFNGEYAHKGVFGLDDKDVEIISFSTDITYERNKLKIDSKHFYTDEILSVLFNAKAQTQKPFIKRLLKNMRYAREKGWGFSNWLPNLFAKSLVYSSREVFDFIKEILQYLSTNKYSQEQRVFLEKLSFIEWNTKYSFFFINELAKFNTVEDIKYTHSDISGYDYLCRWCIEMDENGLGWCEDLILNSKLQLASDMLNRYAQFDHINPLIHRIEAKVRELEQIIKVTDGTVEGTDYSKDSSLMTVYSFRECGTDIKAIMPLLIAKMLFGDHKKQTSQDNIDKTIHLIIDEAHNILSSQTDKSGMGWQDYRLETFEEVIKEGRKFGFFLTICSQRPFDISPTIISQVHNYFIHRLVNNKDLEMIDNTIPTLDRVTKSSIPTLSKGDCVISGTALSMPVFIHVDQVNEKVQRPSSDNINLCSLWGVSTH